MGGNFQSALTRSLSSLASSLSLSLSLNSLKSHPLISPRSTHHTSTQVREAIQPLRFQRRHHPRHCRARLRGRRIMLYLCVLFCSHASGYIELKKQLSYWATLLKFLSTELATFYPLPPPPSPHLLLYLPIPPQPDRSGGHPNEHRLRNFEPQREQAPPHDLQVCPSRCRLQD